MGLFCQLLDRELPELHAERVQMRFIGPPEELDQAPAQDRGGRAATAENARLRLFIAMNYGGRAEILDAARRFGLEAGPDAGEAEFAQYLYGPDLRDPELIIRTSEEPSASAHRPRRQRQLHQALARLRLPRTSRGASTYAQRQPPVRRR